MQYAITSLIHDFKCLRNSFLKFLKGLGKWFRCSSDKPWRSEFGPLTPVFKPGHYNAHLEFQWLALLARQSSLVCELQAQ